MVPAAQAEEDEFEHLCACKPSRTMSSPRRLGDTGPISAMMRLVSSRTSCTRLSCGDHGQLSSESNIPGLRERLSFVSDSRASYCSTSRCKYPPEVLPDYRPMSHRLKVICPVERRPDMLFPPKNVLKPRPPNFGVQTGVSIELLR